MTGQTTVGIIANPASARDVRRLVAQGGAVTTHDKLNRLHRVLTGLAATGVGRVISMSDRGGITAGLRRAANRRAGDAWPVVEFVEQSITHTAADTAVATRAMVELGVGAIVVLGGDGTNRVVARESSDVPLVSISTGTNNTFPTPMEPTIAGLAAGLVASNAASRAAGTYRAKTMEIRCGDRLENALVDVAITRAEVVGSGAVWDAASLSELFLCFAEPDAIGLSAIGGQLRPVRRRQPAGLHLRLGMPATTVLRPPIGPGLLAPVGVRSIGELGLHAPVTAEASEGVVAIDGERMFRFGRDDRPTITLRADGPVVVDATATLDHAARHGLLATTSTDARTGTRSRTPDPTTREPNTIQKGQHRDTNESTRALHRDGPHPAVRIAHLAGVPR